MEKKKKVKVTVVNEIIKYYMKKFLRKKMKIAKKTKGRIKNFM